MGPQQSKCQGEQRKDGHLSPESLLEGLVSVWGLREDNFCPRLSGPMTHRKASELWQDVMSASSAGQPGLGARPGPGWAPQEGHLQPSTENIKPNQLGSFSRCTNLFNRTDSNKPRESWALHEAQQNPQASDFPMQPLQQGG